MFSALDDKERDIVIKAMEEKSFKFIYILYYNNKFIIISSDIELGTQSLNKGRTEITYMSLIKDN